MAGTLSAAAARTGREVAKTGPAGVMPAGPVERPASRQRVSASRTCSGVGAVPPRWDGIHQVSFASLGRTG